VKKLIFRIVNNNQHKKKLSSFQIAKAYRLFLITLKRQFKDYVLISVGIFLAAFGFKGFLQTNHFIDVGATCFSLLISALYDIPLYILIMCVNFPFILLAYHVMGKTFAIKTFLAIKGL
jgi:uncharacterized membrane-anchored protein YitT (DUF2179 family)